MVDFQRLNQKQLASALGKTDRTIRNIQEERGFPRNKDKTYSLPEVIQWLIDQALLEASPSEGDRWLTQFRKERALMVSMEREQLEKKLIPIEEVEQGFSDRAYELARRLLLMSRRIGQRIAGKSKRNYSQVCEIIDAEVMDAMNDYARPLEIEIEPIKK